MLGIENLKKLIKFALDLSRNIQTALGDKKVTIAEIFGFLPELMQVPGIVKAWTDIKAEYEDLSKEERLELHSYVVSEFDIPNDKVEAFIENALLQAISLITLVEEWKDLKKPLINGSPENNL